jgi:four helix bundle protein
MDEEQFKQRTRQLALRIMRLVEALPDTTTAAVIGKQILRSATSVGACYRAACRGRSTADVIAKLGLVEEEADATVYWLEMLIEGEVVPEKRLKDLLAEANEIVAMTVASIETLRAKANSPIGDTGGSSHKPPAPSSGNPKSTIENSKS